VEIKASPGSMDLIVDPIEVKVNFSPGLCDREAWQEPACPMIMEKNSITATEIEWLGDGVDEPKGPAQGVKSTFDNSSPQAEL
jgi:hypothetical protein